MNVKRADGYLEIHKGIRRELCNWIIELGRLDGSNDVDVLKARSDFSTIEIILQTHASVEEEHFHPLLLACDENLVADLEREHKQCDLLLSEAIEAFDMLCEGGTNDHPVWELQRDLCLKFAKFTGRYLVHLDNEESNASSVLWKNYSDEEILGLIMKVRGSTPPEIMAKFLTMMIPAVNVDERVAMFTAMKASAPQPAFEGACAMASNLLSADEWAAVCDRVGI
jgi:hypothetical protein